MPTQPPISRGDYVRLRHDVTTRGGVRFRAGVLMRVRHTEGEYNLEVRVRGRAHGLTLTKRAGARYLVRVGAHPNTKETE